MARREFIKIGPVKIYWLVMHIQEIYSNGGVRYADACNADWVIFNPESGYILPHTIIEEDADYEKQKAPFSLNELQDQVRNLNLMDYKEVIALGSELYSHVISQSFLKTKVITPFTGLSARKYIQVLKNAAEDEVYSSFERTYQVDEGKPLEYDEIDKLKFLWSYWKLPVPENAFSGRLEGPQPKKDEIEWEHFKISVAREFWRDQGPKPGAWSQFHATTYLIGKKLLIQLWDPIMWLCDDEGPDPFEGYCAGVNLAHNEEGYLQCYMHLKDVRCPKAEYEWDACFCMRETAEGGFLLSLGRVFELSVLKSKEKVSNQTEAPA